jgi:hypothetical protein
LRILGAEAGRFREFIFCVPVAKKKKIQKKPDMTFLRRANDILDPIPFLALPNIAEMLRLPLVLWVISHEHKAGSVAVPPAEKILPV